MASSTSYRLDDNVKQRLALRAHRQGMTATALLARLITEGLDALDHPGIVHRGTTNDRRAGVAGGPDVWEVVARLRELEGPEGVRIRVLTEESGPHPRLIRTALDFASLHPEAVRERPDIHETAIREGQAAVEARRTLLA